MLCELKPNGGVLCLTGGALRLGGLPGGVLPQPQHGVLLVQLP